MHGRIPAAILFALLFAPVSGSGILAADYPAEPDKFFREFVGLKDDQIREIHEGKAVAKVLDSPTADQVFVFGSVYIHSTPERASPSLYRYRRAVQASELPRFASSATRRAFRLAGFDG
jgi:hypothetical protein